MARFVPIRTGDPNLDRIQDAVAKAFQLLDAKPVVTGSRGGNAALKSLIDALVRLGLIVDETGA